jgi:hypothetical protein
MANQTDNVLLSDDTTGLSRSIDVGSDALFLSTDLTLQAGGVFEADNVKRGTGDPNGVESGNEGDVFLRTDAGNGEIYVNDDGTNTGWRRVLTQGGPGVATSGIVKISSSGALTTHATISAALTVASAQDTVLVGVGTYAEDLTIPANVRVLGAYGARNTRITGTVATTTRVTLSSGSVLAYVTVTAPTNSNAAVSLTGSGTAFVDHVVVEGTGGTGRGFSMGGSSHLLVRNCKMDTGTLDVLFECVSGTLDAVNTLVSGGTVSTAIARSVTGGTILLSDTTTTASVTLIDQIIEVGAATVIANNVNVEAATTFIHMTDDASVVRVVGFNVQAIVFLIVDGSLTGGTLRLTGGDIRAAAASVPAGWYATADVVLSSLVEDQINLNGGFQWIGDLTQGTLDQGGFASFGQGGIGARGVTVLTTDATATAVSDGGNFLDVTSTAVLPGPSTFTFQGTGVNHTILVGCSASDGTSLLRYYSWFVSQTTGGAVNGQYVFEVWDGAQWSEVGVMATSFDEGYKYANQVFLRGPSTEFLRFGIESAVTWTTKTINTVNAYWIRARIAAAPSVLPTFNRLLITRSNSFVSPSGQIQQLGVAQFRQTITAAGNVFGESGGVTDASVTVGSGGDPTGWGHTIKNSLLNGNGDAIYFQFPIPRGICTAYPLNFEVFYQSSNAASVGTSVTFSVLPQEVSGVPVADPAGGVPTVARTVANTDTLTANAGQAVTVTPLPSVAVDKIHLVSFEGYDISSYYEGDMIIVRFEYDNDGTPNTDLTVWAIEISGVRFTAGTRLD